MEDIKTFLESIDSAKLVNTLYTKVAETMKEQDATKKPNPDMMQFDMAQKFTQMFCIELLMQYHEWNKNQISELVDKKLSEIKVVDGGTF